MTRAFLGAALLAALAGCGRDRHDEEAKFPGYTTSEVSIQKGIALVEGTATISAPAQLVRYSININFEDSADVQRAYERHRAAEEKLVALLKEMAIPTKSISYDLIQVSTELRYRTLYMADGRQENQPFRVYKTGQQVSFRSDSVRQYALIATRLIQAGFTDFTARLAVPEDREKQLTEQVLAQAVKEAEAKAKSYAKAADLSIGDVVRVADTPEPAYGQTDNGGPETTTTMSGMAEAKMVGNDEPSTTLSSLPAQVKIKRSVKVWFEVR